MHLCLWRIVNLLWFLATLRFRHPYVLMDLASESSLRALRLEKNIRELNIAIVPPNMHKSDSQRQSFCVKLLKHSIFNFPSYAYCCFDPHLLRHIHSSISQTYWTLFTFMWSSLDMLRRLVLISRLSNTALLVLILVILHFRQRSMASQIIYYRLF